MQRRHEVADDGRGNRCSLWEPAQSASRPHLDTYTRRSTCGMTSRSTCRIAGTHPVTSDLPLVGPLVGLGDPEVNCHNHALAWPSPRPQGRSGGQGILGIDDAVARLGETPAQRVAKEHLMPVSVPDDPGGTAAALDRQTHSEDGQGECPIPRVRIDHWGVHVVPAKIFTKLSNVRINAGDAVFSQH